MCGTGFNMVWSDGIEDNNFHVRVCSVHSQSFTMLTWVPKYISVNTMLKYAWIVINYTSISDSDFVKEHNKQVNFAVMLLFCAMRRAKGCHELGVGSFSSGWGCMFVRLFLFVHQAALWLHCELCRRKGPPPLCHSVLLCRLLLWAGRCLHHFPPAPKCREVKEKLLVASKERKNP